MILDLGCGKSKFPNAVGIDIMDGPCTDIVHDLNVFPYPVETNSVECVICNDIIEHLDNIIKVMGEIHRVCKNNANIYIRCPYCSGRQLWCDITHRRGMQSNSFDHFTSKYCRERYGYTTARYNLVSVRLEREMYHWYDKLILKWINKNISLYETRLMYIYPVDTIHYILKVIK